jgi:hypothetical protein
MTDQTRSRAAGFLHFDRPEWVHPSVGINAHNARFARAAISGLRRATTKIDAAQNCRVPAWN